ncbi:class A sortase [Alkalibaculum bacchi]|nr:class A sortase [Alkalibaculum bacchi]
MKKTISTLLIIIGILLVSLPYISDFMLKLSNDANSKEIDKITWEDIEKNQESKAEFNLDSVQDVNLTRTLLGSRNLDRNLIIGQLIIPDIDLSLPILKGISERNLLGGVGTMKKDQKMGQGNYTLAGHYVSRKDTLFGGLMDIKEGSTIYMTDKKTMYEYIVYKIEIVQDTAIEMLSDDRSNEREKPIASLMTCYYSSKTGKRFFAIGELVDQYPYIEQ